MDYGQQALRPISGRHMTTVTRTLSNRQTDYKLSKTPPPTESQATAHRGSPLSNFLSNRNSPRAPWVFIIFSRVEALPARSRWPRYCSSKKSPVSRRIVTHMVVIKVIHLLAIHSILALVGGCLALLDDVADLDSDIGFQAQGILQRFHACLPGLLRGHRVLDQVSHLARQLTPHQKVLYYLYGMLTLFTGGIKEYLGEPRAVDSVFGEVGPHGEVADSSSKLYLHLLPHLLDARIHHGDPLGGDVPLGQLT
uniref:Uncharacterized protein n=1 Tax=Timema monikensis TaxID=170555 RepID=A0A7R9E4Q4_9NEOP|nr:unnamed protein product [Timema monikensis]